MMLFVSLEMALVYGGSVYQSTWMRGGNAKDVFDGTSKEHHWKKNAGSNPG
jgi:hypothetical protein